MKNDHMTLHKKSDIKKIGTGTGHRQKKVRLPVNISRGFVNYAIDVSILASGLLCAVTGIVKWPGLAYSLGMSYGSLPMEAFTLIHDWTGIVMMALALAHVIRHWRWLAAMTRKIVRAGAGRDENEKA